MGARTPEAIARRAAKRGRTPEEQERIDRENDDKRILGEVKRTSDATAQPAALSKKPVEQVLKPTSP